MNSYTLHDFSEHIRHSREDYLRCIVNPPRGLAKLQPDTVAAMLDLLPKGTHYQSHLLLQDGRAVDEHQHPEWVALFYVDAGDPPHPIVIEGERVQPKNGDCLVMPPGVRHHVEPYESKHPRILFAVLLTEK